VLLGRLLITANFSGMSNSVQDSKIAVCIHVYYTEVVYEMTQRIVESSNYQKFDIYATTDTQEKAEYIIDKFYQIGLKPNVLVLENRGRDILPFLILLQRIKLRDYTLYVKLHTKGATNRRYSSSEWRDELYEFILNFKLLNKILQIAPSDSGIIIPSNFNIPLNRYIGKNFIRLDYICRLAGFNLNQYLDKCTFPAGSMFICTKSLITELCRLNLQDLPFEKEPIGIDGTFAHAVERFFGVYAYYLGLKTIVIGEFPVCRNFKYL
jgi:lipopolysaccharide biosynthesis protein